MPIAKTLTEEEKKKMQPLYGTDFSKPISASNPPPSRGTRDTLQGDTLQTLKPENQVDAASRNQAEEDFVEGKTTKPASRTITERTPTAGTGNPAQTAKTTPSRGSTGTTNVTSK
jgi:hypothetical protein